MAIYKICQLIKITQASYFLWLKKSKPAFNIHINPEITRLIFQIFIENDGKYGAPRIKIALSKVHKLDVSEHLIWRYMTFAGIKSFVRKKKLINKPKESKNMKLNLPNLVNRKWDRFKKKWLMNYWRHLHSIRT